MLLGAERNSLGHSIVTLDSVLALGFLRCTKSARLCAPSLQAASANAKAVRGVWPATDFSSLCSYEFSCD